MKRKIVFINQATGYLTIDIINNFAKRFDKVSVIYGDIRVQDVELDPRITKSKVIEKSRKSNLHRFIRWIIATVQIYFLLFFKYRNYEVFYFSVPPFAYMCSLLLRRRFSILMWDVYPDALKIININNSNPIYKLWTVINIKLFQDAYRIYTIGDGLKELISQYVDSEKVKVISLWTGITNITPIEKKDNLFIKHNSLQNKFIVQYSGNIGPTHNIESLIEVAKLTKDDNKILYLIIGRGTKFDETKKLVKKYSLNNFLFLPFQPDDMIKYSLAAADLSVVLIDEKVAKVSIPSKVYNIIALATPILSISPNNSEINKLLTKYNNGKNFTKNDIIGIKNFILEMKNSPEKLLEYKNNSVNASKYFTIENSNLFLTDYLG